MQRLVKRIPALFAPFTVTFKWNEEKLEKSEDINQELKKDAEIDGPFLKKEIQNLQTKNDVLKKEIDVIKNEIQRQNCTIEGLMKKEFIDKKKKQANEGRWSWFYNSRDRAQDIGNKWNIRDSGSKLSFRQNAHVVLNIDSTFQKYTIRAKTPVPKINLNRKSPCIIGYYEVEIVKREHGAYGGLRIGFCDKQFPLEDADNQKDSIGIFCDEAIEVNGSNMALTKNKPSGEFFNQGNVIGCGILYTPNDPSLKCFVTLNGEIFGSIDLPLYFANIDLFPAVSLWSPGESIKANFGEETWRFNPSQLLE